MPTFRGVVRLDHPSLGGSGTNTWHVRTSGPIPGAEADLNGLSAIIQQFYDDLSNVLADNTQVNFDGVWTQVMDPDPAVHEGPPWLVVSTSGSGPLPPANAIVVGWRAQTGGRSGRGRTFLGPITTVALQADGTIEGGILTSTRAAAEALVTSSEGFDNGAVGVFSPTDQLFRDFVTTKTRDLFAVLRSRRD